MNYGVPSEDIIDILDYLDIRIVIVDLLQQHLGDDLLHPWLLHLHALWCLDALEGDLSY